MYNDELEAISVELEHLFLDPNNPRFSTDRNGREIPENKISDDNVQKKTQEKIETYSIVDLRNSILQNGFLKLDRIVVKGISGKPGDYVAVEGNRRLAALKSLYKQIEDGDLLDELDEEGIDETYIENLKKSIQSVEVLLYKGNQEDISWMLQGIRHISGIKDWQPAQRAQLVAKLKEKGSTFTMIGHKFGLSGIAIGRLYRAYKGLEQMRNDDEYGCKSQNDYFSLFEEAYKNSSVRSWLEWDEDQFRFNKIDNLKQFYSWISPSAESDEHDGKRRIHDPKHVRHLNQLIAKDRTDLIDEIDQHSMDIEAAWGRASKEPESYNWKNEIEAARKAIEKLPNKVLMESSEDLKEELTALKTVIEKTLAICS